MISKIKEIVEIVKSYWQLFVIALCAGYVLGALTIGPLAALIQYIKDVI